MSVDQDETEFWSLKKKTYICVYIYIYHYRLVVGKISKRRTRRYFFKEWLF